MATFSIGDEDVADYERATMSYPDISTEEQITQAWLLAIELGNLKRQIVTYWSRIQKLEAEMDERPEHPKLGIAHMRCDELTWRFIYACVCYQQVERRLQGVWQHLSPQDRDYPAEVLGCPRTRRDLLGGFRDLHPQVAVPAGFLWPESALHWVAPQQEDALVKRVGVTKALRMSFMWTRDSWEERE